MGLFDWFKKTKTDDFNIYRDVKIHFSENCFQSILDDIIRFIDAYSESTSGGWYTLFISLKDECHDNITRVYLHYEIQVDYWHDKLLYLYPDIADYANQVLTFDPQNNSFTYNSAIIGSNVGGAFPYEKLQTLLQTYLNNYEAQHPTVNFKRFSWGASLTNLKSQ